MNTAIYATSYHADLNKLVVPSYNANYVYFL